MQLTRALSGVEMFAVSILYEADRLCNAGGAPLVDQHPLVSILYEADRLCNQPQLLDKGGFALVSILYEADRLCNDADGRGLVEPVAQVSILYEADRLCNGICAPSRAPSTTCFNPLRGRQTLQPGLGIPHLLLPV